MMIPGCCGRNRPAFPCRQDARNGRRSCCGRCWRYYLDKSSSHPLPPGAEVRDVYLVDPGLAVIDINDAFADAHRSGVLVEELTVASLVQTLATGVPGINRVKILVGGKERETLAGHADLSAVYDVSAVSQMVAELQ